jgi:putative SOS response-associated peptidase YedK
MCGRITRRTPLQHVIEAMSPLPPGFEEFDERSRFNIAPSQTTPIARLNSEGNRVLSLARWGLIPAWTKGKPKIQPINAKAETISTSGMFRQAFERRRCLLPADGFYEWKGTKPPKQPYFIHKPDDSIFAFAGLWDRWRAAEDAEPLETFTIITTTPNALMATIHNRMPVIVKPRDYRRWLDPMTPGDELKPILEPYLDGELEAYPVSRRVNSRKNDDAQCTERVG